MVVWTSAGQDGDLGGVVGRVYDSAAVPLGPDFVINAYTTGDQNRPVVAALAAGGFVVSWDGPSAADAAGGISARLFSGAGSPLTGDFQVNAYTTATQNEAAVAAMSGGGFVVGWTDFGARDGSGLGVFGRLFDASGAPTSSDVQLNAFTASSQSSVSIAASAIGDFTAAWTSSGQDGSGVGIFASRFDAVGARIGTEFAVNTYTTGGQQRPDIAVTDAGGAFVVVWEDAAGADGGGNGVFARRFDASAIPVAPEFLVNVFTTFAQIQPVVGRAPDDGFVVAWASAGQDGSDYGVFARNYDDGGLAGPEFAVNIGTSGAQDNVGGIGHDPAGRGTFVWRVDDDGSGSGIMARRTCSDDDADTVCDFEDACPGFDDLLNADGDALPDDCDACPADPDNDTDGDLVCGDVDNCPDATNPGQADTDVDTVGDACDLCPGGDDLTDGDGDGFPDACDVCPLDALNDSDSDGHCADVDNCPTIANPGQADADLDSVGDACDACPLDADNDADADLICGNFDNCPDDNNASQVDADSDNIGDPCDTYPLDPDNDSDTDAVCGDVDNCPSISNPAQDDTDSDTVGDVCDVCPGSDDLLDTDSDGTADGCDVCPLDPDNDSDTDGVCGDVDNCPAITNAGQADTDSDTVGDACDVCVGFDDLLDSDSDGTADGCDSCPLDADNDSDTDGVCGDIDNCPSVNNASQADVDSDTVGDACDVCPGFDDLLDTDSDGIADGCDACPTDPDNDTDIDGVCGDVDNCPTIANPGQGDADTDSVGDACDACPGFDDLADADADTVPDGCDSCPADPDNDVDTDGVCGDIDNCPVTSNSLQADEDLDGIGNPCDACLGDAVNDPDLDGLCAIDDNCPTAANASQLDLDNDDEGDVCDGDDAPGFDVRKIRVSLKEVPERAKITGRGTLSAVHVLTFIDDVLADGVSVRVGNYFSGGDVVSWEFTFDAADCELKGVRVKCADPARINKVSFAHNSAPDPFKVRFRTKNQTVADPASVLPPMFWAVQTVNNAIDRRGAAPSCKASSKQISCSGS